MTLLGATRKLSNFISRSLENYFFWHGVWIAKNPIKTIVSSMFIVAICGVGLINFYEEKNMVKLWIPKDADFARNNEWLWQNFPPDIRFNSLILFDNEDILRPDVIQEMYRIHKRVLKLQTSAGHTWNDICFRLPVVKVDTVFGRLDRTKRNVREDVEGENLFEDDDGFFSENENDDYFKAIKSGAGSGDSFDPSVILYPDQYCPIVEAMNTTCFVSSLLEMFAVDGEFNNNSDEAIANLTKDQLIHLVNTLDKSGLYLQPQNFSNYLGGITRNESGHIIKAKATFFRWFGQANSTSIRLELEKRGKTDLGLDQQPVDVDTYEFEALLLDVLNNKSSYPADLDSRANVQRSYGDISSKAIWDDVIFLSGGFMMIYAYVQLMLGKFNAVEQRAFLAFMGITSCGLAFLISMGLCSLFGLHYGPMHSIIPCLLIGLGVDDMFVIVQSYNNAEEEDKDRSVIRPVHERIGRAMRTAGVGITVTSFTDFVVFAIGGTTVLPSLRSYSIFTAIGILATYFLQITYFTAWLSIDQKRIDDKRNGMLCCYSHGPDWTPNKFSQRNFLKNIFAQLGKILTHKLVKVLVISVTMVFLAFGIWGTIMLDVKFKYVEFLPQDSTLYEWFALHKKFFPGIGERGTVYLGNTEVYEDLDKIKYLVKSMEGKEDMINMIECWYEGFELYVENNFLGLNQSLTKSSIDKQFFNEKLTQFLFSPSGAKFMDQFDFSSDIVCGQEAPVIKLNSFHYYHPYFNSTSQSLRAMNFMKDLVSTLNFSGKAFSNSQAYSRWEIDEIIARELYRNLGLAIICVTVTTLILIADLRSSLFVILNVVITLVDVGGAMHAWGLTIDIVACTNIIISVGLCVDFSAHIAHSFMVQRGSRDERIQATLKNIGPAVLNGGVSTLISVLMLMRSKSHVFLSYFKVFFLMITFGLFHGLIFLPVLLSLIGSPTYPHVVQAPDKDNNIPLNSCNKSNATKFDENIGEEGLVNSEEVTKTLLTSNNVKD